MLAYEQTAIPTALYPPKVSEWFGGDFDFILEHCNSIIFFIGKTENEKFAKGY